MHVKSGHQILGYVIGQERKRSWENVCRNLEKHHLWISLRVPNVPSYALGKYEPFLHIARWYNLLVLESTQNYTWVL